MYSGPVDRRLLEAARMAGEDLVLADLYERSPLGGMPPGADPRTQQNQGIDWLNAAGLGALAAGLTAGGVAGYRNRDRIANLLNRGGNRPPTDPPGGGPAPTRPPQGPVSQREAIIQSLPPAQRRSGAPAADWSADLGRPTGNQVVDLASLGELENLRNSVRDPRVSPWRDRTDDVLDMFANDRRISQAQEAGGKVVVDVDPTGREAAVYSGGVIPSEAAKQSRYNNQVTRDRELTADEIRDQLRAELVAERLAAAEARSQPAAQGVQVVDLNSPQPRPIDQQAAPKGGQEINVESTRAPLSLMEAMGVASQGRFNRDKERSVAALSQRREGERVANLERLQNIPGMIDRLAESGYGVPAQRDAAGNLVQVASIEPELVGQLLEYRDRGVRSQRMKQEIADLLGIESSVDTTYMYDTLPAELMQEVEQGVGIPRANTTSRISEYNGLMQWPDELKDAVFDSRAKTLRMRPDMALQLIATAPENFDKADALTISQFLNSGDKNWKRAVLDTRSQLRQAESGDQQAYLESKLSELMSLPEVQRPFYGLDANTIPEVSGALDRVTQVGFEKFFKNDPNGTVGRYLASGGELQDLTKKGGLYTEGEDPRQTRQRRASVDDQGNISYSLSSGRSAARRGASDLEAIYRIDGQIGTAKELGILPGMQDDVEVASGLGNRSSNVIGFTPRESTGLFTELPGTNASGVLEPDLVDPDSLYATGAEDYANTSASKQMSDDAQIVGRVHNADSDIAFAHGLSEYGKPVVPTESDFLGQYVGGIRGFYGNKSQRYPNEPGVELAPVFNSIQEAREAGVIKNWNPSLSYSVEQPAVSSKLFYADDGTLVNADIKPLDRKYGFIEDGTPRDETSMNAMIKRGLPRAGILTQDINRLSERYNRAAENINRLLSRGNVETTAELTGINDLGLEFAGATRDALENPDYARKLFGNSTDPRLSGIPLPVDLVDGEKVPIGLVRTLKTSGGRSYTQPVAVQMPKDARVNDALSMLLASIHQESGGMSARDRERLARIPEVSVKQLNKNGELVRERISPLKNPGVALAETNRTIGDSLIEDRSGEMDQKLDDLLAIINQDGNVTPAQEKKLLGIGDSISDLAQYIPDSYDYNEDAALIRISKPADNTPVEMVQAFDNTIKEGYRKGIFPPKGTLSDAKDYNIAVPLGGTEDTYQYQKGKSVIQPQLWAGVQLAQMDASKDLGANPVRIPALDTAIAASQTRGYRFAGKNPIEERAKAIAATIPQLSMPGYRLEVQRPYTPKDPKDPRDRGYAGGDNRETISSYGVDEATRLATRIRGMREGMDPTDPKYGQLVELESSVLKDVAAAKPPGPGPLLPITDTEIRIEQERGKQLAPIHISRKVPENIGAKEGKIKGAQLASLGQELLDQAKANRAKSFNQNPATERPNRKAAMQGAPAQTVMDRERGKESGKTVSTFTGDVGVISGDPMNNLRMTRKEANKIQNPGPMVGRIAAAIEANKQAMKEAALQSPAGQFDLVTGRYNVGGNMLLGGPANLQEGTFDDAVGVMKKYNMTPHQVANTMNTLMSQARERANREVINQRAQDAFARDVLNRENG